MVNKINEAGAQLQLHDITYPEPREGDASFLEALEVSPTTVISQVPVLNPRDDNAGGRTGLMTHPVAGVMCSADGTSLPSTSQFVASAAIFSGVPKGHGAAHISNDGAVRSSPAVICVDGAAYPSLAVSAFLQLGSARSWGGRISPGSSLCPRGNYDAYGCSGLEIP